MSTPRRLPPTRALAHIIIHLPDRIRFPDQAARTRYAHELGQALATGDAVRLLFYAVMPQRIELAAEIEGDAGTAALGRAHALAARVLPAPAFERATPATFDEARWAAAGPARAIAAHVHNAPVRAGETAAAWGCKATSHCAYVGLAPRPTWLCVRRGLALLGLPATPLGRRELDELVVRGAAEPAWSPARDPGARRRSGRLETAGPALRAPRFLSELETFRDPWPTAAMPEGVPTARVTSRVPQAVPRETTGPVAWPRDLDAFIELAADLLYVNVSALRGERGGASVDAARMAVVWAWTTRLGGAEAEARGGVGPAPSPWQPAATDPSAAAARSLGDWLADEYLARRSLPDAPEPRAPARTR